MPLLTEDFSNDTLTQGVNAMVVSVGPVALSGIFVTDPISTTTVSIELLNQTLSLVPTSPRGGVANVHPNTTRNLVKLTAPHLRTSSTILADSWQNRTGFGQNGTPANILQERDRILGEHSARISATIDFHQSRALAGQILDSDGSIVVDLLSEFAVSRHVTPLALNNSATKVATKIIAARRLAESELGMAYAKSWVAFASASFIDALRDHPSVASAVEGWAAAGLMLADHRSGALVIGGVRFIEVPNRAGKTYIDNDTALLCPEGVPGLFKTHFAPADYVDAVNKEAIPIYTRAEELPFNRGVSMETQSNPLSIVTRPKAVVTLTI